MRILYGVVGEGMGHATRSRVVLEHLLEQSHDVCVVVSGRAHGFLSNVLARRPNARVIRIEGFTLAYGDNAMRLGLTVRQNLGRTPRRLLRNVAAYRELKDSGFRPDVVMSDFESWAHLFGMVHDVPVVSLDNMQVLHRCRHGAAILEGSGAELTLARAAVKLKLPHAYHYLVTSFFVPEVQKPRTSLVPPVLRPEILHAERAPGEHVLVYQTAQANPRLLETLGRLPHRFRVYGLRGEAAANVELRPFSETGFIDDLRTARAVISGGGYSLMGEAVHLGVPMLSVPIAGQFEQELNARYLSALGYGAWARRLDQGTVQRFLDEAPRHAQQLARYVRHDNRMLTDLVDELLQRAARGETAPERLSAPALAKSPIRLAA